MHNANKMFSSQSTTSSLCDIWTLDLTNKKYIACDMQTSGVSFRDLSSHTNPRKMKLYVRN